jgi:cytochrome o ubiquinol oxidase operon protein cyoD
MSDHSTHAHGAHGHGHDDHGHGGHGHDAPGAHGSMKDYTIGFILSVILTAIPFWLVMAKVLPPAMTGYVLLAFAGVQVIVHMIYFLHMNSKIEHGWSMMATIFTVIVLIIMMAGSIWVMYHMNANMMPGMQMDTDAVHGVHDMP